MESTTHWSASPARRNAGAAIKKEYENELARLRKRDDYSTTYERFLEVLSLGLSADEFKRRHQRPLAALACVQAPLELFDALGFQPFRMRCGSHAAHGAASSHLPALACPVAGSCAGHCLSGDSIESQSELVVIPTTCDWTVKLPDVIKGGTADIHIMELPHLKESERGRERWTQEVRELKKILERKSGARLSRHRLQASIAKYGEAWDALGRLVKARRARALPGVWFIVMANAFLLDDAARWTEGALAALDACDEPRKSERPAIFLAGSPVSFPNLKIARLIEEAGMDIVADEMCTSERILVGAPVCDDPSEEGLLTALAERYMLACHCPSFANNDRRLSSITEEALAHDIRGVIHHVLKGCHPYDIESHQLEKEVKAKGLHFIKIETDYSPEDERSVLVRLEAFKESL